MVVWPNQPSLPPGAPLGWVIPPGTDPPPTSLTVWTQQQIEALRTKLQESLMQLVALAVQGFLNTGEKAFDQVASWASQIDTAANGAADDLAALLDGILGTGHTIGELVDHFQALGLDVSQNVQNWVDLLQGAGQGTATEVGEMLTTAAGQAEDVFNELAALLAATGEASFAALWAKITSLLGFLISIPADLLDGTPPSLQELLDALAVALGFPSGATSSDIQTYLTNAAAGWDGVVAAVADFVDDVADATGLDDVAASINSAVSDAADAVSDLTAFLGATGQSGFAALGAALQTLIGWLSAIPANLLSGALPTSLTYSGTTLSTLLQNLNSSGQFAVSGLLGDITRGMSTDMQTAIDALANAFTGGTYGIPQTPVPTYGSTGVGKTWTSGNDSWSHTVTGNAILVFVTYLDGGGAAPTFSIGGQNIPVLGSSIYYTGGGNWKIAVYGKMTPPTGAQTVSCVPGVTHAYLAANSISYSGVSSLGSAAFTSGVGTAISHNATGVVATDLVAHAATAFTSVISGYNRTQRWNVAYVGGVNLQTMIGDATAGGTSITFSGTATPTNPWGSVVAPLHGITTTTHAAPSVLAAALAAIPGTLITGALNTAITVAGTQIGTVASRANQAATDIAVLISGVSGAAIGDVVTFIQAISTAITALKNALSGIFNPLQVGNVSLPNLVSQIQSGLQGLLPAVVDNLDGTLTALTGLVDNLDGTFSYAPGSNPLHTLVDQADGTFATVANAFQQAAQAATEQVGSNLTAAAANVQGVINSLFGAFGLGGGTPAPASTPAQATQAVVSAQQQLLDNAAGLAALQAVLNQAQNGGGLAVSINFPDYADGSLPGIFTATANLPSNLGITAASPTMAGGYLVDPGGGSGIGYSAMYNVATTNDDQQIISGVFTGVSSGNRPVLIGRANSAGTTYVAAMYQEYSGIWIILAVVAGTPTVLGYATDTFSNGAVYSLQCGTGAVGNRIFKILKNNNPLTFSAGGTSLTEVGTTSQLGSSYRGGGLAVQGTTKCSTWTMIDNTPPAAVGSGFHAYRTSTSAGGSSTPTSSTGGGLTRLGFPASWLDTIQYQTADLSYTSSTNTLTVSVSGWYSITIGATITCSGNTYACLGFYQNGSWANRMGSPGNLWGNGQSPTYQSTFTTYCAAGDTLQPAVCYQTGVGAFAFSNSVFTGGQGNYFSVTLANRGTLS